MRCACIDIGSNTTRLLVADCLEDGLEQLHQERAYTHLALGGESDAPIPAAKLDELAEVVADQLVSARRLDCDVVRVVATAAIRRASNGEALAAAIYRACGVEIEILTAEEEARLAFLGAARTLGVRGAGELGVVDVGGGSSELVVGEVPDRIRWWASFPLGSGDLARRYLHSDPPSPEEVAQARQEVASTVGRLEVPHPARAAAVGGSAASLASLAGRILDTAAFARAMAELVSAPRHEVAQRFDLEVERVRLLPAGLLILQAASERFRAPLVVAGGGLREGVLMEAAGV